MDALLHPPITFAHRGARSRGRDNTLDTFRLALDLGASGLESDAWLTEDGVVVLDHDGVVRRGRAGLRREAIAGIPRTLLPPHIPSLEDLYDSCGTSFELSLDIKDPHAAPAVVAIARGLEGALPRLWLCSPSWEQTAEWRQLSEDVRLVDSTRLRKIKEGPERRAAVLADKGIDAVNLHHTDWTGGLTTLFHRFERLALGWDCQHERVLAALLGMGIDGVYSDDVETMVDVLNAFLR
ncbi:MAG TPA: glycerophosphodiester phosphodiesterase [Acidimicrobiales bacterium]|nr:glycerophosphodiester phosphodiesterase [Acidimicrobiales bacterium]